jgi:hypothetical protein
MAYNISNNVAQSFVCRLAIKKYKYYDIRNCNCCFILCEAWSLVLRWEHRLRVFKNRVLRRTRGPWRDDVTWEWRLLHNEEPYNRYSSPNTVQVIKSRRIRWAGHVAHTGDRTKHTGFFGQTRWKETIWKTWEWRGRIILRRTFKR